MSADIPPEAFTKETLQEAFAWLQSQPDLVRNSVHTKERLVSLYRRSQRLNDGDHPVSSKKFITDLKALASTIDQFNGQAMDLQPPPPPPFMEPQETIFEPKSPKHSPTPTVAAAPPIPPPLASEETTMETVKKASFEVTTNTRQTTTRSLNLDSRTEERIQTVQNRFNLSSREEALRLLVSLGYEKFNEIP